MEDVKGDAIICIRYTLRTLSSKILGTARSAIWGFDHRFVQFSAQELRSFSGYLSDKLVPSFWPRYLSLPFLPSVSKVARHGP